MGTIRGVLRKYQALRDNMDLVIERTFEESKESMAAYNVDQLERGEGSDGQPLKKYRNPEYAQKKNKLNPIPGLGNPDLRVTGAYHKSLYVEIVGDRVRFLASDIKAPKLEEQFGTEVIYGHNQETRKEFIRSVLRPAFMREVKDQLSKS
jgi:hypothetical protein